MEVRGNALAIAGLGSPVWDLAASDHQPENFYNCLLYTSDAADDC